MPKIPLKRVEFSVSSLVVMQTMLSSCAQSTPSEVLDWSCDSATHGTLCQEKTVRDIEARTIHLWNEANAWPNSRGLEGKAIVLEMERPLEGGANPIKCNAMTDADQGGRTEYVDVTYLYRHQIVRYGEIYDFVMTDFHLNTNTATAVFRGNIARFDGNGQHYMGFSDTSYTVTFNKGEKIGETAFENLGTVNHEAYDPSQGAWWDPAPHELSIRRFLNVEAGVWCGMAYAGVYRPHLLYIGTHWGGGDHHDGRFHIQLRLREILKKSVHEVLGLY